MPLAKLYVEGDLDNQLLTAVLEGSPVVQYGGSKNALKSRVLNERRENKVLAAYLRDRDFDFDPPEDLTQPTQIDEYGWRWCRHEMENYLLEPGLVHEALGWPIEEYQQQLRNCVQRLKCYQAARWSIGIARRALPPHYRLNTSPADLNELELPQLDNANCYQWIVTASEVHYQRINQCLNRQSVEATYQQKLAQFGSGDFVADIGNILLWFSGKNLFAGLQDWFTSKGKTNAGSVRADLRDWVIDNPERIMEVIPEWLCLRESLRQ